MNFSFLNDKPKINYVKANIFQYKTKPEGKKTVTGNVQNGAYFIYFAYLAKIGIAD